VHGEHGRDVEDPDGLSRKYQWVRRIYSPFVTRYIALSTDLEDYLRGRVGIAPQRIEQIYNGVDTQRFHPPGDGRAMIRGCPFQDPSLWLVGSVGRLVGMKDPVNLARAFLHALELHPQARQRMRLVVVGDGALRAEFEQLLRDAGALDLAWFAGDRRDVSDIMRGLDCFVLPSLVEGISNAILEAMASGLPVIATCVGGNAELIEVGMTGKVVPRADHAALAAEIVAYFAEPAIARQHGGAGRARVERGFSLDRMVERYDVLYSNILGLDCAESASARRSPRESAQG
jgi:sugar transferase (PEP-CTERM/EpsH1 system associated)